MLDLVLKLPSSQARLSHFSFTLTARTVRSCLTTDKRVFLSALHKQLRASLAFFLSAQEFFFCTSKRFARAFAFFHITQPFLLFPGAAIAKNGPALRATRLCVTLASSPSNRFLRLHAFYAGCCERCFLFTPNVVSCASRFFAAYERFLCLLYLMIYVFFDFL